MSALTRDDLIAATKPRTLEFKIGDKTAFVRSMLVSDLLALKGSTDAEQGVGMIVKCLCDANSERLLSDDDSSIAEALPLDDFNAIVTAAAEVNGLTKSAFKEIAKN